MADPAPTPPEPARPFNWIAWGIVAAVIGGLLALIMLAEHNAMAQRILDIINGSLNAIYVIAALLAALYWLFTWWNGRSDKE